MADIGSRRWAIAEGYIPGDSSFEDTALTSHEAACILNPGDQDANIAITLFFTDREPVGPIASSSPPGGRDTSASMISTIRSRCRGTRRIHL